MARMITFGEIMMRVATPDHLRFNQTVPGSVDVTFAGSEANVAASVAYLGGEAAFVTALPNHELSEACVADLRRIGVDTQYMLLTESGRLGVYFLETGANQRPSKVIYDRLGSSISLTPAVLYPWESIFEDADWFHISGITPAISETASEAALIAAEKAKESGLTISCDLNFRSKLWRWDSERTPRELAENIMRQLLGFVDVVIGNEEDADKILGIQAEDTRVEKGHLAVEKYPEVAREIVNQFENVGTVVITLRESISATHNNWGAMLYEALDENICYAPTSDEGYQPYQIKNIVDRVGGGDAFAAGLIYALNTPELSNSEDALSFAVAASCLAHSIQGDYNYSTREEVETLMQGSMSGRVRR